MSKYLIYALHHPTSDSLYVGKSSSGMYRPRAHLGSVHKKGISHLPVARWIRKLLREGHEYEIVILEECEVVVLNEAERFHIAYLRSIGAKLLNCTDGGDGQSVGYKPTSATKAKQSASLIGRPFTPERLARNSPLLRARGLLTRGKPKSAKGRENIATANKRLIGVPRSEIVRAQISIAQKGIAKSDNTRRRMLRVPRITINLLPVKVPENYRSRKARREESIRNRGPKSEVRRPRRKRSACTQETRALISASVREMFRRTHIPKMTINLLQTFTGSKSKKTRRNRSRISS